MAIAGENAGAEEEKKITIIKPLTVLAPSATRTLYVRRLQQDEKELAALTQKVFGEPCHPLLTAELETAAVLPAGVPLEKFPLAQPVRKQLFARSPIISHVAREPTIKGSTKLTPDGHSAVQIEFVTQPFTRIYVRPVNHSATKISMLEKAGGRRIKPEELARTLEILPKFISEQASAYGLERMDISAVPFIGDKDQGSGLQANINLVNEAGKNMFEKDGRASPLMLCFIRELIDSDRDATAFFAPTPQSFKRLKGVTAPNYIGLGSKRISSGTGSMLIRGPNYNTSHDSDGSIEANPDIQKKTETGGTRLEHRQPSPEMLTVAPEAMPYIWIHYYLDNMKRAIVRYDQMQKEGTLATLNEESLREQRSNFPKSWEEAVVQFNNSPRLKEVLGDDHKVVSEMLAEQAKKPVMPEPASAASGSAVSR